MSATHRFEASPGSRASASLHFLCSLMFLPGARMLRKLYGTFCYFAHSSRWIPLGRVVVRSRSRGRASSRTCCWAARGSCTRRPSGSASFSSSAPCPPPRFVRIMLFKKNNFFLYSLLALTSLLTPTYLPSPYVTSLLLFYPPPSPVPL